MDSNTRYVINGTLDKNTIPHLMNNIDLTGFIWRGFTYKETQMLPSAAFYGLREKGRIDALKKADTQQPVFIAGELQRIACYINTRNKDGEYPFEIPDELTDFIFPYTRPEMDSYDNLKFDFFPKSNALLQAASYVQHYHKGTSLLDFSINPLKALYFAIGEDKDLDRDSYLFGLPINWFQSHKNNFTDGFWSKSGYKFDLYLPSYYMNKRIQNQEGVFIYQMFDMKNIRAGKALEYKNILDLFENWYKTDVNDKGKHMIFDEMNLKDIAEKSANSNFDGFEGRIGIFYILLKISKEDKRSLKCYLNSIGINDEYLMGNIEIARVKNTKMNKCIKYLKSLFRRKDTYRVVSYEEYKKHFGITPENGNEIAPKEDAREKQEKALDRAWETRNFEIDKFWQRSAFFWGFIALVLGAFVAVQTGRIDIHESIPYPDLYLILLGLIVSVAWLLVVKGSKFWQENWEAHIDRLEDAVTGPLYKTVNTKGKGCFSVSRINKILAWTVIFVWGLLFLNFLMSCDFIQKKLEAISPHFVQISSIVTPIVLTIVCIIVMIIRGQSSDGKYKIDKKEFKNGVFVERTR